jgi:S-adenosylmethionine-diacylglycerol 3-amino-3-carboxypropyl transferase
MKPPYDFGLSQEDERTECTALRLPGGRVLSIASAGDIALSLLALGAEQVTAVDIAPGQIALGALKQTAVLALSPPDAVRLLGFQPATRREREAWLALVIPRLPAEWQPFWLQHRTVALRGAIWGGRSERYLGVIRRYTAPFLRRGFLRLSRAATAEAQARIFEESIGRPWLRAVFRTAFHPAVYGGRGVNQRSLQYQSDVPLGERYYSRFRDLCTRTLASENHYFQLFTLGRVLSPDVVPAYLTPDGSAAMRAHASSLEFRVASILDTIAAAPPGRFNRFHLSNVPDWLPPDQFHQLMRLIAERAGRPARVVWRGLHRDLRLGGELEREVHEQPEEGKRLQEADRFPFYAIHVAEVG